MNFSMDMADMEKSCQDRSQPEPSEGQDKKVSEIVSKIATTKNGKHQFWFQHLQYYKVDLNQLYIG